MIRPLSLVPHFPQRPCVGLVANRLLYSSSAEIQPAPAPPKRPANAYSLFTKETHALEAPNGTDFSSRVQRTAQKWNSLSVDEKSQYQMQAKRLRDQYKDDLAQYHHMYSKLQIDLYTHSLNVKHTEKVERKLKREKSQVDPMSQKPKRLTGWNMFLKEFQQKSTDTDKRMSHLAKKASEIWKSMDDQSKSKYLLPPAENNEALKDNKPNA